MAQLTFLAVGIIFALVGAGIVYLGINAYLGSAATVNWPSVTGTILTSSVNTTYQCTNTGGTGTYGTAQSCGYVYTPLVSYRYIVNGITYTGHNINLNYVSSDSASAYAQVQEYQVGTNVSVYYNPQAPYTAVLQTGATVGNLFLPLFGAAFLIVGIILAIKGAITQGVGFSPPPAMPPSA